MDVRVVFLLTLLDIVWSLSCGDVKKFVDSHNDKRRMLAKGKVPGEPVAAKMNFIIWDQELADKAQNWASTKIYGHNPNRNIATGRFTIGENIYQYSSTDPITDFNVETAVNDWFDEYKHYTYKKLEKRDSHRTPQTGHYTQIAWADTIYLGCGVSTFHDNGWHHVYIVCDYGPPGNIIGRYPYKSGKGSERLTCGIDDCSELYGSHCS